MSENDQIKIESPQLDLFQSSESIKDYEQRPLITFCLLTYNQDQFIREAVEGALSQTYTPLEIILSDDCSSDSTFSIIEEIAKNYHGPHTVILNRNDKNIGLVPHINKVYCEIAHGELLVAAAGDDVSVANRVEILWRAWEATDRKAIMLSSGALHISAEGETVSEWIPQLIGYDNRTIIEFILNPTGNLRGPAAMFHRTVFDTFGPLTVAQVEDGPLIIRSKILGPVYALPEMLIKYRLSDNNMTSATHPDYRKKIIRGNIWRISIYDQIMADLDNVKTRKVFSIVMFEKIMKTCHMHRKKHELMLQLIQAGFIFRFYSWLRLLSLVPFSQSINNVVFLTPLYFYPKLMKYGMPTDSRLWKKICQVKRSILSRRIYGLQ